MATGEDLAKKGDAGSGDAWRRRHEQVEAVLKLALRRPDITAVAAAVVRGLGESAVLNPVAVFLVDEESGRLRLAAQQGMPVAFLRRASRAPGGEGIFARVLAGGKPVAALNFRDEAEMSELLSDATGARLAVLPVHRGDEVAGLLTGLYPDWPPSDGDSEFIEAMAGALGAAVANIHLFESFREAFTTTVRALAAAVDGRDFHARGHSDRVAVLAAAVARELGMGAGDVDIIRQAGFLHDIGKLSTSSAILVKENHLTTEEQAVIRRHPGVSFQILEQARIPSQIKEAIRHHHESFDGSGYPDGLAGDEIPIGSRILCVADAYEAMTADRAYRPRLAPDEAAHELQRLAGRQFDPDVVAAFLRTRSEVDVVLAGMD